MTDLDSTLSAIDAATGCQQCEGPLGDSPSDDFCSVDCREDWYAARCEPLADYREPVDLAAHVDNQVELYSPETASPNPWHVEDLILAITGNAYYRITGDGLQPLGAWPPVGNRNGPPAAPYTHTVNGLVPHAEFIDEIRLLWNDTAERLREQLTGEWWDAPGLCVDVSSAKIPTALRAESECGKPNDLLDGLDWDWKPVPALADGPRPPVMAPIELDIEAIQRQIDGGYLTDRVRRAVRRIDSRGTR